jgi:hypothetical protein
VLFAALFSLPERSPAWLLKWSNISTEASRIEVRSLDRLYALWNGVSAPEHMNGVFVSGLSRLS